MPVLVLVAVLLLLGFVRSPQTDASRLLYRLLLLLVGVGVGLHIAALLVPPDPVDEKYEAQTVRKIARVFDKGWEDPPNEPLMEQATQEAIRHAATKTARKLGNWGWGFFLLGGIVKCLSYYVSSPRSLPLWWPSRRALIDHLEARDQESRS